MWPGFCFLMDLSTNKEAATITIPASSGHGDGARQSQQAASREHNHHDRAGLKDLASRAEYGTEHTLPEKDAQVPAGYQPARTARFSSMLCTGTPARMRHTEKV